MILIAYLRKYAAYLGYWITFANSMDTDQARQNVCSDLGPNCLTLMVFLKEFFEKVDFEKNQQTTKSMNRQRVNGSFDTRAQFLYFQKFIV